MEQREKLIELMQSFQNEYPKSFDALYYEFAALSDYLLANGVVVLPCRCKECSHAKKLKNSFHGDDFCSHAKRKGG